MKIGIITGARPQFIKIAPIIHELQNREFPFIHIHSGQHYSPEMSQLIFDDLLMPQPDFNLNVGSAPHGEQTGQIMQKLERILMQEPVDLIIVPGDTNTTLAGALVGIKLGIPIIHLEAGLRSNDWFMPEEINRILVDRISSLLIVTTDTGLNNLIKESFLEDTILRTGDTMVDALYFAQIGIKNQKTIAQIFEQLPKTFLLCTLHRPANVDNKLSLTKFLDIAKNSTLDLVIPLHPRTKMNMEKFDLFDSFLNLPNLHILPPMRYLEFIALLDKSRGILTDSGGVQKEAFILKKPCITLRESTEWKETLDLEANLLLSLDVNKVVNAINLIKDGKFIVAAEHPYGDGLASKIIIKEIEERYNQGKLRLTPNMK